MRAVRTGEQVGLSNRVGPSHRGLFPEVSRAQARLYVNPSPPGGGGGPLKRSGNKRLFGQRSGNKGENTVGVPVFRDRPGTLCSDRVRWTSGISCRKLVSRRIFSRLRRALRNTRMDVYKSACKLIWHRTVRIDYCIHVDCVLANPYWPFMSDRDRRKFSKPGPLTFSSIDTAG